MQRGLTYLGAVANGKSTDEASQIANSAISNLEGLAGKRHLLQVIFQTSFSYIVIFIYHFTHLLLNSFSS